MAEVQAWNNNDAGNTDLFPENMPFNGVNDAGRAVQGVIARWYHDGDGSLTAGGAANVFTLTSNRTIPALFNNLVLAFTANHAITGAATLNLNGTGAKTIKRFNGSDLAAGDIVSGQPLVVIYKSSPDVWFMMTAPAALITSMFADFSENVPGNPAADVGRLYAKDDSGNTILAYRDNAGVETPLMRGTIINRVYAETTAFLELTTEIPYDDTIPQNTEGDEILTASITLKKSTNRVRVWFQGWASTRSTNNHITAALFQDSIADALNVFHSRMAMGDNFNWSLHHTLVQIVHEHAPGTVGPITYKIRAGPNAGTTMRFHGDDGGRKFGGVARATLVLEEIHV